ncbi:MAG: PEGA domain-containing protein [Blastocatellia bacterium]|nr:PEGA domain-containing protein [Blastocatellia bacterium]
MVKKPTIGSLVILTDPPTAEVFLNQRSQGKTSLDGSLAKTLSVKPGTYVVTVKHPDYEEFQQKIAVRAGVPTPVKATLTARFGFLRISFTDATAGNEIQLDGKPVAPDALTAVSDRIFQFKTTVGTHRLTVSRPVHQPFSETVEVLPGQTATLPVNLTRQTAELLVRATAGAQIFLDGKAKGIVPQTGQLLLAELPVGQEIKVSVEAFGYETFEKKLTLQAAQKNSFEPVLVPLPTVTEFADNFQEGLKFWDAPPEWSAANSIMLVKPGKTAGFVKNKRFCDGDLYFGLRMQNERGASWIVRAQDEKNYYLFCLNGPGGPFPNTFQTYLCRDGVLNLNEPLVPGIKLPPVKPGETYRVHLRMQGTVIEHWLTPSRTGEDISIGFFKASTGLFPCGGVGFATPNGEDFQVNGFLVQPLAK